VLAQAVPAIAPFAAAGPGAELAAPWRARFLPGIPHADVRLVEDAGARVLRIRAEGAAGSAIHPLAADPAATPRLSWRWKVDRALGKAEWGTRAGDDFAARVYVAFDLPAGRLTLLERAKLALARIVHGDDVPAAALCYVWASGVAPGTSAWNPYASRVRMVALESGNERAGTWVEESRDVAADFRAAFGEGAVPRLTGVAASTDTDQTLEAATAWFADFRLEPRR
jgi:hypothetical protein